MEAIVVVIAGIIELVCHIFAMAISFVFEGFLHLASKPNEGESRFSVDRLVTAIIPLMVVLFFVVIIYWTGSAYLSYVKSKEKEHRLKRDTTKELVVKQIQIITDKIDDDGTLIKHPEKTLDVKDMWGNSLHVDYNQTLTKQKVTVRSASFDKKIYTSDDITETRYLPRKKSDVAKDMLGKAKKAIIERINDHDQ
jgi:uncharacterized membrane protein